jgi:hypothetical protein
MSNGNDFKDYVPFRIAEPGSYGHPDVDPGPRTAEDTAKLIEARAAFQFGSDIRFRGLVGRVSRMFDW